MHSDSHNVDDTLKTGINNSLWLDFRLGKRQWKKHLLLASRNIHNVPHTIIQERRAHTFPQNGILLMTADLKEHESLVRDVR